MGCLESTDKGEPEESEQRQNAEHNEDTKPESEECANEQLKEQSSTEFAKTIAHSSSGKARQTKKIIGKCKPVSMTSNKSNRIVIANLKKSTQVKSKRNKASSRSSGGKFQVLPVSGQSMVSTPHKSMPKPDKKKSAKSKKSKKVTPRTTIKNKSSGRLINEISRRKFMMDSRQADNPYNKVFQHDDVQLEEQVYSKSVISNTSVAK